MASFLGMSIPAAQRASRMRFVLGVSLALLVSCLPMAGQVSVTTWRNDTQRDGQNLNETILNPTNVNTAQFGQLFTQAVDGYVFAQPLYLPSVTIGGQTQTHNVVFVATEHDSVFAFDADTNGGSNGSPLWFASLLTTAHGAAQGATTVPADITGADIVPEVGITGTPVIDPVSGTLYVVSKTMEGSTFVQRLHALDVTTGNEKFGGPVVITATIPGTGHGSSHGSLTFDPEWQNQRPALLLINGIVYIGWGSHGDVGPWHGWIMGYNAQTLQQTGVFCSTANGVGGGIWMGGAGLAAEVNDPVNHPYGRMFIPTGNGDYTASTPYATGMDFGDSILNLDLTNGVPTVQDEFTPANQSALDVGDLDIGSGGVMILPVQTTGNYQNLLVQAGKAGEMYLLDRDALGGYNTGGDQVVQEIPNAVGNSSTNGTWSMGAFFNGVIYYTGSADRVKGFPLVNGQITGPTLFSSDTYHFPGANPSISANGNTQGIIWTMNSAGYSTNSPAVLEAYNAATLGTPIYTSSTNVSRDDPGPAVKFTVPTVVNGKVYVPAQYQLSVYGLLGAQPVTATPVITPGAETFSGSVAVSITDTTPGAVIYYTTNGTTPTTSSPIYSSPITLTATTTVEAMASAPSYDQSTTASAAFALSSQVATPVVTPAAGTYTQPVQVTIADASSGAAVYYTTDGSNPTTSSTAVLYSAPFTLSATATVNAIGELSGSTNSNVASSAYTINLGATGINFPQGFASSQGIVILNGNADTDDSRLQLTDGGLNEASSAWYYQPVSVQAFTTAFTFQLSNPGGNGITFAIQGNGTTALGSSGSGLGYQGIPNSIAIKFDFATAVGAGMDSTGEYSNGASPTVPAIDLSATGINLMSDDTMNVQLAYNGTILSMTITDVVTGASYSTSWPLNIPSIVGGSTAYVGFTGGSGAGSSSQKVLTWVYTVGSSAFPLTTTPAFAPAGGSYSTPQTVTITSLTSGAAISYTTDGSNPATSPTAVVYSSPVAVNSSATLNAVATAPSYASSTEGTAAYTIALSLPAPTFSPAPGIYPTTQTVSISDGTAGTTIYYTTNGSTPTTSSSVYGGAITVSATETLSAIAVETGYTTSAAGTGVFTINPLLPAPTFSPAAGTYTTTQTVAISDGVPGTTIYYTTNGTPPTTSSSVYTGAVTVSVTETLQAIAVETGFNTSSAGAATYSINPVLSPPTFSPAGGTYTGTQNVTLNDATPGTTIYYTTNGTTPTTASAVYGGAIPVSATETLEAIAAESGYTASPAAAATYTIATGPAAATPVFSPAGAHYATAQTVTISDSSANSTIYYTTNGTAPTTSSAVYGGAIAVSSSQTLEAIATTPSNAPSKVATATYTLPAATPVISPGAGTYNSVQTVTITDATPGATIYFTLDGTNPNPSSPVYSGPITPTNTQTIKAGACAPNDTQSSTAVANYGLKAGTPVISPGAGTYAGVQTVTITDVTPGATIYYTVNGTVPTTSSAQYGGPFTMSATGTVEALAVYAGFTNSAVATAAFTITAAMPTFNPPAGSYNTAQTVTLSAPTTGTTIYYTTNGSTPTILSTVYGNPITVSATETIRAIAAGSGITTSPVAAAVYTIAPTVGTPVFSPAGGTYTSTQTVTIGAATGATIYYTTNGTTPTTSSSVYGGAITVSATETLEAIAIQTGFANSAVGTAAYTINSALATPAFSPAAGTYTTTQTVSISAATGTTIYYTTNGTTPTTSSNVYSGAITVSATETLQAIAVETGFTTSTVGMAAYTISSVLATPTFSPTAGTYTTTQTVSISAATGTTIYYTTNGTTPTTSSSVYSGAITVGASETLEAIAVETGFTNSAAGTAAYTINSTLATPTFSPVAGTYTTTQTVSISAAAGTTIYYTTNGTTPTTSSSVYSGAISVSATETLEAIAVETGFTTSMAGTAAYTINPVLAMPAFSPAAGTYTTTQTVSISAAAGTTIYYTTNGTTPTTSSSVYSSALTVSATETLEAIAVETGFTNSAAATAGYIIGSGPLAATPVFSPAGGHYAAAQSVTINDSTANATIYYTTNGTVPTTSSSVYSGTIAVNVGEMLEAIAIAPSFSQSKTASANYMLATATPVISPAGGGYNSAPTVTITDATSGAIIYYTLDGTNPTPSSPVYSGPIVPTNGQTIKAGAIGPDDTQSSTAVANYGLKSATPVISPGAGTYVGAQTVTITDLTPGVVIYYTTNGTAPTILSNVYSGAFTLSATGTVEALAVATGYTNSAISTAAIVVH